MDSKFSPLLCLPFVKNGVFIAVYQPSLMEKIRRDLYLPYVVTRLQVFGENFKQMYAK